MLLGERQDIKNVFWLSQFSDWLPPALENSVRDQFEPDYGRNEKRQKEDAPRF